MERLIGKAEDSRKQAIQRREEGVIRRRYMKEISAIYGQIVGQVM